MPASFMKKIVLHVALKNKRVSRVIGNLNLDAANAPLGDNLATPVAPSQWDMVLSTPDDVWSHEFFEFFYFKLDFLHSSSSLPYLCTLAKYIIMNSTNASDGAGQRKRNVPDVAAVVSYCAV